MEPMSPREQLGGKSPSAVPGSVGLQLGSAARLRRGADAARDFGILPTTAWPCWTCTASDAMLR